MYQGGSLDVAWNLPEMVEVGTSVKLAVKMPFVVVRRLLCKLVSASSDMLVSALFRKLNG